MANIRQNIAKAKERQKVFHLLLHAKEPLCVLRMLGKNASGDVWVENGRIIAALSTPNGEQGAKALLTLLELDQPRFELTDAIIGPQGESLDVSLEDLVGDFEKTKAALIKQVADHNGGGKEISAKLEQLAEKDSALKDKERTTTEQSDTAAAPIETAADANNKDLQQTDGERAKAADAVAESPTVDSQTAGAEPVETPVLASALEELDGGKPDDPFYQDSGLTADDDDHIASRREAELQAASVLLSEPPEKFYEGEDPDATQDIDVSHIRRQHEYDRLKDFYGRTKEEFYDAPADIQVDEEPLSDLQKKVLKIMETEGSSPEVFESSDPVMSDNSTLLPKLDDEQKNESAADNAMQVEPLQSESEAPQAVPPSPFADQAVGLSEKDRTKHQLSLKGQADAKDLLKREAPEEKHEPGSVSIARRIGRQLTTGQRMAIAVAILALPMFGLSIIYRLNYAAQADRDAAENTGVLVSHSIEENSMANQAQEPFRLPQGGTSPTGAPGNGSGGGGEGESPANGGADAPIDMYYKPSSHPLPAPAGQELLDANQQLATANQLTSTGRSGEALRVLISALTKFPGDLQIRLAAIRAYMAVGEFRNARALCIAGMDDAANAGDFQVLRDLLATIPRQ